MTSQVCLITFSDFKYPATQLLLSYPDGSDHFYGIDGPVKTVCSKPEVAGGTIEWTLTYINGSHSVAGLQSTNDMANLVYEM